MALSRLSNSAAPPPRCAAVGCADAATITMATIDERTSVMALMAPPSRLVPRDWLDGSGSRVPQRLGGYIPESRYRSSPIDDASILFVLSCSPSLASHHSSRLSCQ